MGTCIISGSRGGEGLMMLMFVVVAVVVVVLSM